MARNKDTSAFKSATGLNSGYTFRNINDTMQPSTAEYQRIEKQKIVPSPYNEGLNMDKVTELASSMQDSGLMEPITVYDMKDGTYQILSGHQRFEAWCNLLGNDTIPAVIREYEEDPVKRFKAHTEANTLRRDKDLAFWLTRIDNAKNVLRASGFDGSRADEIEQISDMLSGVRKSTIYRYEGFSKLVPELQRFETEGLLSAATLYEAVGLDASQQKDVASIVCTMREEWESTHDEQSFEFALTRDSFKRIVSEVKNGAAPASTTRKPKAPTYHDHIKAAEKPLNKLMSSIQTDQDAEQALTAISELQQKLEEMVSQIKNSHSGN